MLVSDEKLFAIVLYSAFVNNDLIASIRDIWKNSWVTGTSGALVIGLVGALAAPFIISAIINGLGFGVGGIAAKSFGSWYMSLHGGMIARGSLISILQSIGAAGLGPLGIFLTSSFGGAIGILIGAIGGSNLASYFREMDLNGTERQLLERFIQIEESNYQNNSTIIVFTLMPALLYNDKMLRCFFETFVTSSPFANSKLFRFDFIENNLLKLKSEEERVNYTVYNSLISDYDKSRLEYIFRDDYFLIGYKLNLDDHKPSNLIISTLVEVWNVLNGKIVVGIDVYKFRDQIDKYRNQINDQISKIDFDKYRDQASDQINNLRDQINKIDFDEHRDQVNDQINYLRNQINDQINKIDFDKYRDQANDQINNLRDQINDQINKIDVNKFSNQISDQVNYFSDLFHKKFKKSK
ncbi:uncharacterized protein OCT59_006307 [Rhizophagus irregularis]|uniref:Uncharacterized protein n=2 Tax=Rhizophagus irregularis TaxID=588596 RepID=A0A015JNR2_RHIIW|nr:hypothetical protein GLOIN_2v1525653 [Rhizophagus irregularis DAOM 181602=DAOM 197198]EXX68850.1 hypothetical protein RirG_101320 [Rhizophagus irregularis DAOM 197198w]UZO14863.1 hypothetical protein OCT59_006307 [Rhizophagus irregularis]POG79460.1 hypothetical protein GLOIN_2v1525653 [Rhizophagus irregularis DAOM 181602=DAOM 197198]CAG8697324.1 19661_t:CDS:1 [Rhizophagus irregularis]GET57312.1 interferon alpha-inducible protein 27, mitochondrial isoform 1 [Rhizophagus irregularis DAOM 1816|eukprot:XP_025186326.1 hypothetical protein GLOIN_2v1525653 [Rhizophagus irregularis DAOM 181602=DAOM 197198]